MSDLYEFKKDESKPRVKAPESEDRHVAMMEAIAPFAKNKVQGNLTTIDIIPATKKTRLFLMLLPEWSPNFPPFNTARLASVAKHSGYETKCLDLNIKLHNVFRELIKSIYSFQELKEESSVSTDESKHFFSFVVI